MNLRSVEEILPKTRVILRIDADLPVVNGVITDTSRLEKSLETIKVLVKKECHIAIIGHRGRPQEHDESLSLRPIYLELVSMLESGQNWVENVFLDNFDDQAEIDRMLAANQIVFFENLRFWPGEEKNEPGFMQKLTDVCQFFVNDAFAVAHRRHASIMLHKIMPGFFGLSFIQEAEKIGMVVENPQRPLTVILGGAKEDKLNYVEDLANKADYVLIGGKLPRIWQNRIREDQPEKIIWAELRQDGLDLSDNDIARFIDIVNGSKTVIWAGAMGYFEDQNCQKGTIEIAKAVANNSSFKIIAGGDTGASVINLGLRDKIDLICSGGGVMLEMLTKGSLPAWE